MKRISVSSGKIVFEEVLVSRLDQPEVPQDIEISPETIAACAVSRDPDATTLPEISALLQFGIFFELAQLNQRIGSVNLATKQGVGLQALVGQQTVSMIEISEKLGKLTDQLDQMLSQAAAASSGVGMDKAVKDAVATVTAAMGGLMNQTPSAEIKQPMTQKGNSGSQEG